MSYTNFLSGSSNINATLLLHRIMQQGYFRVSVPYLRSENVVTKTSFEGTGVIPNIEVPADRALEAAVEDALR